MTLLAQNSGSPPPEGPFVEPPADVGLWEFFAGWSWWANVAFTIWMVVWCVRNDPERGIWLWIILLFPVFGPAIYFLCRWLPGANVAAPGFLQRLTRRRDINRLQIAARQIGNPHQYIELGDALRESGQWEQSLEAYLQALKKDPQNPQALWGAGCGQFRSKQFQEAHDTLAKLLSIDAAYKFGDVSLLYGKSLHALGRSDEARHHLEGHIRRWRHPEALHLLACLYADNGQPEKAREQLQNLIMDIEASPSAIARKQSNWKGRAKKLLRKLPS